jgi:hypothetical protein
VLVALVVAEAVVVLRTTLAKNLAVELFSIYGKMHQVLNMV